MAWDLRSVFHSVACRETEVSDAHLPPPPCHATLLVSCLRHHSSLVSLAQCPHRCLHPARSPPLLLSCPHHSTTFLRLPLFLASDFLYGLLEFPSCLNLSPCSQGGLKKQQKHRNVTGSEAEGEVQPKIRIESQQPPLPPTGRRSPPSGSQSPDADPSDPAKGKTAAAPAWPLSSCPAGLKGKGKGHHGPPGKGGMVGTSMGRATPGVQKAQGKVGGGKLGGRSVAQGGGRGVGKRLLSPPRLLDALGTERRAVAVHPSEQHSKTWTQQRPHDDGQQTGQQSVSPPLHGRGTAPLLFRKPRGGEASADPGGNYPDKHRSRHGGRWSLQKVVWHQSQPKPPIPLFL